MVRERGLLDEHEQTWLGPLVGQLSGFGFRRGFLDCVGMDGPSFETTAADVFRLGPPPSVLLFGPHGQLPAFLANPFVPRIKRLTFVTEHNDGSDSLQASDMELLAATLALSGLTSLSLRDNNQVGPEGVQRLTAAPWLAGLRELNLVYCYLGAAGVEALAGCPNLAALERLDLGHNLLTAAAMQALASSRHLTPLRELVLESNEIDAAGAQAIASNQRFADLEELDLAFNPLGDGGVERLAQSSHLRKLARLRLRHTHLQAGGLQALVRSPVLQNVRELDLANNHLVLRRGCSRGERRPVPADVS